MGQPILMENFVEQGGGGILKSSDFSVYRWVMNCGEGTNTKDELMGVWATTDHGNTFVSS
jgi:hypothetical protein